MLFIQRKIGSKALTTLLILVLAVTMIPMTATHAYATTTVTIDLSSDSLATTTGYMVMGSDPKVIILTQPSFAYTIIGENADKSMYAIQVGTGTNLTNETYNITLDGIEIVVGNPVISTDPLVLELISGINIMPYATADITLKGANQINTWRNGDIGAGIHVPEGAGLILRGGLADSLNIETLGTGIGGNYSGSGDGENAGNITIAGGNITIAFPGPDNSPKGAARTGIGGGYTWDTVGKGGDSGTILISGGLVTIQSDRVGIGGGGGRGSIYGSTDLTVTGGKVDAQGWAYLQSYAPSNNNGDAASSGIPIAAAKGSVCISGGEVVAQAGINVPAIWVGADAELFIGKAAKVALQGGVTAASGGSTQYMTDGSGAAVGGLNNIDDGTFYGKVIIEAGADVTLTGGAARKSGNDPTVFNGASGGGAALGGMSCRDADYNGNISGSGIASTAILILPDDPYTALKLNGGSGYIWNSAQVSGNGAKIGSGGHGVDSTQTSGVDYVALVGEETLVTENPAASIVGGSFSTSQTVTLGSGTVGATILYTLDGSNPKVSGTAKVYSSAVKIDSTVTLKAFAYKGGMISSNTLSETYTVKPPAPLDKKTDNIVKSATFTLKVSGTYKVGKKLKAKVSNAAVKGQKYTYRWLRNGKAIKGSKATKATYKLTKKDKGKKISVKVTAKSSGLKSVTKTSKAKKVK